MNKNRLLSEDAFAASTRGRFIAAIEMGLVMAIIIVVAILVMHSVVPYTAEGKERAPEMLKALLLVFGTFAFLVGTLFGGSKGMCFFSYKLFPPSNEAIKLYKRKRCEELKQQIKWKEESLQKMKQELAELSS